jgi:hypothetical protein
MYKGRMSFLICPDGFFRVGVSPIVMTDIRTYLYSQDRCKAFLIEELMMSIGS